MSKVRDLHQQWSQDPDYRAAYESLGPEFELTGLPVAPHASPRSAPLSVLSVAKKPSERAAALGDGKRVQAGRAQVELEPDRLPLQRRQRLSLAPRHALAHRVAIHQSTFDLAVARVLPALRVQHGHGHLAPARVGIDRKLLTGADEGLGEHRPTRLVGVERHVPVLPQLGQADRAGTRCHPVLAVVGAVVEPQLVANDDRLLRG